MADDPHRATAAPPGSAPPAGAEPLLSVRGLEVQFPGRRRTLTALRDVSFDVLPGEILGVVGESGAGKSMTGNAIIGLLEPPGHITGGEVRFLGRDLTRLGQHELRRIRGRDIGAVFQDPLTSLNPLYKIGDLLVETLLTHEDLPTAEAERRAVAMLSEVGIPRARERFHHYPHQFSGGMRQRVVIALALITEPRLVVADEPTTALDVSVQAQIINLLKRLCRERGTAVILITHDMGVIAETADRVCVMYAGRIVEIGPVRDVIKQPRHPYTHGLMAAIPHVGGEAEQLAQIEGSMPRLDAVPPGCAFHPRCPQAFGPCTGAVPPFVGAAPRHDVACYLFTEEGARAGGARSGTVDGAGGRPA